MQKIYNEKLYSLFRDFYHSTGRRVAIFNADGKLIMEYPKERCAFCTTVRKEGGSTLCNNCDKYGFVKAAEQKSVTYRCHAGLIEVCSAIIESGTVIGYLMFGQMRYDTDGYEMYCDTKSKTARYFGNEQSFEKAFAEIPLTDRQTLISTVNIMSTCIGYIQLQLLLSTRQKSLFERMEDYIEANYIHPFSLSDMSKDLSVSIPTLCKCAKQNSGKTVLLLATNKRIEKAKEYLAHTELPIFEISDKVGINDYNYFSRVFKKSTSLSPKAWRSSHS